MIKINLLPAYINQRKRLKVAIAVVTLLVAAEVAGFVIYRQGPAAEQVRLEEQKLQVESQLTALQAVGADASKVNAEEATFAPRKTFVDNLSQFNSRLPDMYRNTASYTYRDAMLLSMIASGPQMSMSAYVSKPEDIARLMLGLSRNVEFNGLPTITGNPGYDPTQEAQRNMRRDPNSASTIIGGMGMMDDMGGAGMMPGGQMGGAGMGGTMPGPMPGPMMGGAGMMPGSQMGGAGMRGGMMPMGGMMPGGGGGGRGDLNVLPIAGSRLTPRGFTVAISAPLKYPPFRPSYGSSDQQIGGGGGGGMGGMMGGMMGGTMPGSQMGGAGMMPGSQM